MEKFKQKKKRSHGSPLHKVLCCIMPSVTSPNSKQQPCDPGVQKLLSSLDDLKSKANGKDFDLQFLRNFLESTDLQSLVKVHEKVTTPDSSESGTVTDNSVEMANSITELIDPPELCSPEAQELKQLLENPVMQSFLDAHDQIAQKSFMVRLPDIPYQVDEDEGCTVKVVQIVKGSSEPLGATIHMGDKTGSIEVARVMHGGSADRSGLLSPGDEVAEVNGVNVTGEPPAEVVKILANSTGPISLKLKPTSVDQPEHGHIVKMTVRAHFNYDPRDDTSIPCKEAGLTFKSGDILHIVSQEDPLWWQATKEGESSLRAGLLPSKQLAEKRGRSQKIETSSDNKENKYKNSKLPKAGKPFSPKFGKKSKKSKKNSTPVHQPEESETEELIVYEELEKYTPIHQRHRPVVLIGPPGVGRNELKQKLMDSKPEHYKTPIPHTSRDRRTSEVNGEEYIFVSKEDMEKDIANKKFVEHGEYRDNIYGTSLEQIKSVINSGQVCLLTPHPLALKYIRTSELKPFVVLIKAPTYERLKGTRTVSEARSSFDERQARPFTDDELREMVSCSIRLDEQYSHLCDATIVNDDLQTAVNELISITDKLETEKSWVPASWVR